MQMWNSNDSSQNSQQKGKVMTKTNVYRMFTLWVVACCLGLLFALQTKAQIDPSTLHVGPGAGTPCAMGCGGDPNLIPGNTVDVFQNQGGAGGNLVQPLLLILGVPNNGGSSIFGSNPITGVTFINPYPGGVSTVGTSAFATAGTFGLKAALSAGYFGNMTAGEVYSFLTLTGPVNNSNSFTNWSGADLSIAGITATNFGIYVFALSGPAGANLGPMGLVNVLFSSGALPKGTFVVAYGQNSGGTPFAVPFTEAGLVIPEPGSMALFGTGLLVLGGALRRRWHRQV